MRDFFAFIYETVFQLYDPNYIFFYNSLFNDNGYVTMGLTFILIPLVFVALFYFAFWYPYGKVWHWLLVVGIGILFVIGATISIYNLEIFASHNTDLVNAMNNPATGYYDHAIKMRYIYAGVNALLGIFFYLIYSLVFKRFSKLHGHLPI
jgi:hypothetical protein